VSHRIPAADRADADMRQMHPQKGADKRCSRRDASRSTMRQHTEAVDFILLALIERYTDRNGS